MTYKMVIILDNTLGNNSKEMKLLNKPAPTSLFFPVTLCQGTH